MSDEVAAQRFVEIPALMATCQGTEFEPGHVYEIKVPFPNPFGGAPIPADVTYSLATLDRTSRTATVEYRASYDSERLKDLGLDVAREFLPDRKPGAEEAAAIPAFRNDAADCTVNTETGWVQHMTYSKSFGIGDKSHSEKYDISVVWKQ